MTTTLVYDHMLAELASGEMTKIEKQVFEALKEHPAGRTREQLHYAVYGFWPTGDLNKNTRDRKIRKVIESLRDRLIPIVSNSGKAGYRLDVSEAEIRKMIAEWRSRSHELDNRVRRAEALIYKIRHALEGVIPEELPVRLPTPAQMEMTL